ncbi:MAG: ABC transporter ATP-binding protein [Candidatus Saccharimonadales bacterium]
MHKNTNPDAKPNQAPAKKAFISAEKLSKQYKVGRQKVLAVSNVSLEINEGEFVAIVGASGSGKSTLLHLLGGLDKPSSGTIFVDGVRLTKLSDRKLSRFRNRTIGFVFQSFYLQPYLNVRKNIEVAAMPNRLKRKTRAYRAERLASAVGLKSRLAHKPSELSGGQIQRVAIARALLNQPSIILADEPTGNLDSTNSEAIVALFKTLQKELGATVVIATHDHDIAAQADRIITVKDGALV